MKPLVLLHGALGCAIQLERLVPFLQSYYTVHIYEFYGHGNKSEDLRPLAIEDMAQELMLFLEEKNLDMPFVFGYSMGGYVALYLESHHPGILSKLACLGTKFGWNPLTAAKEVGQLDPDLILEKLPAFAEELQRRHGKSWDSLLARTAAMMLKLGDVPAIKEKDLSFVRIPCRIYLGEKDRMVGLEESEWAVSHLPFASLEILPDTAHPLERVDPKLLTHQLRGFFGD